LKLLLDTHIWIWSFQDRSALGRRTFHEIQKEENEVWLSPISVWEGVLLHQKGRIKLDRPVGEWIVSATAGTKEAVITHEIMLVSRQLRLHNDPADRILAATAQVLDLTLVTQDEKLLGCGLIRTLGNR
jgi:PIN domain nuclease of toxin-antitoxin system